MLKLEAFARAVVRSDEGLAQLTSDMAGYLAELDAQRAQFVEEILDARAKTTEELEIDDEPLLSVAEEHVWVQAWIYVPRGDFVDPRDLAQPDHP